MFMVNVGKYTSPLDPLGILQVSQSPQGFTNLKKSRGQPVHSWFQLQQLFITELSDTFQKKACWQKIRSVARKNQLLNTSRDFSVSWILWLNYEKKLDFLSIFQ